jgi:hypothetical protein
MLMIARSLLALLLFTAACSTTGAEGEGEGENAEGEGENAEGEGEEGEGEEGEGEEGEGEEGEGEIPANDPTEQIAAVLDALGPFFARCQFGLVVAVDGLEVASSLTEGFRRQAKPPYPAGTVPDFAAIEACREFFATSTDCNAANDNDSPCNRLFVAARETGDPCTDNRECADGLCGQNPVNDCGVCAVGEPCFEDNQCSGGEACDFVTGRCIEPAALGQPCNSDGGCAGEAVCNFATGDGVCSAPVPDGGACALGPCRRNSECSINNTCRALPVAGQACNLECAGELTCLNQVCVVVQQGRNEGDACTVQDPSSCSTNQTGLFCSTAGTCSPVIVVEIGDPCDNTARFCRGSQFARLSACIQGTCVAGIGVGDVCEIPDFGPVTPCIANSECRNEECVPLPVLGETCEGQCADGIGCIEGTCTRVVGLNERCGADAQCGNGTCVGSTCRFLPEEDRCPVE